MEPALEMNALPIEIMEEIFTYLTVEELLKCSLVSLKWREVINCNKIWSALCVKQGISDTEYIDTSSMLIKNPMRAYRESGLTTKGRLSPMCHWKSHYYRFSALKKNWRTGNFALIHVDPHVKHYKDDLILHVTDRGLTVTDVHKLDSPFVINKVEPMENVDSFTTHRGLLFYTQKNRLVCMKRVDSSFVNHYEIIAPIQNPPNQVRHPLLSPTLLFKITDKFLVIQAPTESCLLTFYNYQTGEFEKTVDLNEQISSSSARIICLEAFDGNVVFSACCRENEYVVLYDYSTGLINFKKIIDNRPSKLIASKNFVCSKLHNEPHANSCVLHVWSVHTGAEVDFLCIDSESSVICLVDNRLIYSQDNKIHVRGLISSQPDIVLKCNSSEMVYVEQDILVVNRLSTLEFWDLTKGKRMFSYFRGLLDSMWVDEKRIVVNTNRFPRASQHKSFMLAFW